MSEPKKIYAIPKKEDINIANSLRELADEIDLGEYGDIKSISMVTDSGNGVFTMTIGHIDIYKSIALFNIAAQDLILQKIDGHYDE